MKLSIVLLIVTLMQVRAASYAQRLNYKQDNTSLNQVFKEIKKQTGYNVVWLSKELNATLKIDANFVNTALDDVLRKSLAGLQMIYTIQDKTIILKKDRQTILRKQQEQVNIAGQVFDTSEPPVTLPGVSVAIKGTNTGTLTDPNGNFSIDAPKGSVLVFSMIGYKSLEFNVTKDQQGISLSLEEDLSSLEEVVVMGMSEIKRKHIASSVASLNLQANLAGKPITSLSQALQGGVTGIQVNQGSGLPGGDAAAIKIRGITTLNNSNPLVLVDGLPMDMNHIDPVTIESVTVLKDAAAAAIYGARAANGVILVTTKRGTPGKVSVVYDGYYGTQSPTNMPDVVDAPTYMRMANESEVNAGNNEPYSEDVISKTASGEDPLNFPNTNWVDLMIYKNAPLTSHSLSVSGGNQLARFAVTGNYMNQTGMIPKTGYQRVNIRANTSISLSENFDIKLDLMAIRRVQSMVNRVSSSGTLRILEDLYRVPPTILPRYPDRDGQSFYGQYADIVNPFAYGEVGGEISKEDAQSSINFQPRWQVMKNLNLRGQFSFRLNSDADRTVRENFVHYDYYTRIPLRTWGQARSASMARTTYYYLAASADYTFRRGNHDFYAIAGFSQEENNSGSWNIYSLMSGYAKLNYSFNDKYLLEGTVRTDGSSRFGPGNKFGFFPSVAVGWNVHNEDFLKELNVLNNFKIRASYGKLGNENIDAYLYQSLINATTGVETTHGNPDISWETVNMLNLGVDIGLFDNNMFELTFDYYNKLTEDIILQPRLPLVGGFQAAIPVNSGEVENNGWELALNYNGKIGPVFKFGVRPGISYNRNRITNLLDGPYIQSSATRIQQVGSSINSIYGYKTNGLLQGSDFDVNGDPLVPVWGTGQKPGDIKYIDLNGNGTIDDADQTLIGDPTPRMNYFANFNLTYKNFDLDFLFQGTGKSDARLTGMFALPLDNSFDGGVPTTYYSGNYWTPERTNAQFPRISSNPVTNKASSDFWFQNGSYLRVKYIQLGYSFKPALTRRLGMGAVRLYFNAQNPFTFTSLELTDPESRGDQWTYSIMKVYTIGASVKF